MKTNASFLSHHLQGMRTLVDVLRNDLVAPRLLREEGWNTADIQFTDKDITDFFEGVGVESSNDAFSISDEQVRGMCQDIGTLLKFRYMVSRGWMESVVIDGKECFRFTPAFDAEWARDEQCQ